MVEPLRHRQTKEAATDMLDLKSPRHTSTLPWSCENALAEALTRRDFGEVAAMVILPSLGVFPSGSAPDARCRTVSGAFATGTKEYL
jgi:hypothetical protein